MQNFIVRITQENTELLNNGNIGCFILPDSSSPQFAAQFVSLAHQKNKLVLAEGENAPGFYKQFNTDGFILNTVKAENPQKLLKQAKAQAPKAVIGAVCRNRRHEAMLVSEAEPDFVIFKFWQDGLATNLELLNWYNDLFLIQCAAQIEEDIDLSSVVADFIIIDDVRFCKILLAK